jgi:hypothetical protein
MTAVVNLERGTVSEVADPCAPTAHEIWTTLSGINVNEEIKTKGGLSYLSWPFAYAAVMKEFPEFRYIFSDDEIHPDSSCTVHVSCGIGDVWRSMWLPVMDFKNKAIPNPNARDISDTKMRCLVKCIAMFGLGHYIYAGEDLPSSTTVRPAAKQAPPSAEAKEAYEATALVFNVCIEETTSREELKKYWTDNKEALQKLQDSDTKIYDKVLANFKAKAETLSAG